MPRSKEAAKHFANHRRVNLDRIRTFINIFLDELSIYDALLSKVYETWAIMKLIRLMSTSMKWMKACT